ncbi:MAG: 30S ribosomal protein S16 [Candidatus Liptonbacteria bacterium]|nr:30S ribosomal protein S16 [Candidatus Liptonbacteria bacterium]
MLVIRFSRRGKKHQPSFRVVVAEKRSKLTGAALEDLGSYNTFTKKAALNKERINYWIGAGAKLTDTVHNLLVKEKVLDAKKVPIHMKAKVAEVPAVAPAAAAVTPT